MAIKVSEVVNIFNNTVNANMVKQVEEKIDMELSEAAQLAAWRCGDEEHGYFWRIGGKGELNEATKKAISSMYVANGWHSVTIINSSENSERPGMHVVILCLPPGTKVG